MMYIRIQNRLEMSKCGVCVVMQVKKNKHLFDTVRVMGHRAIEQAHGDVDELERAVSDFFGRVAAVGCAANGGKHYLCQLGTAERSLAALDVDLKVKHARTCCWLGDSTPIEDASKAIAALRRGGITQREHAQQLKLLAATVAFVIDLVRRALDQ
jgi:hypothetical protein